MFVRYSVSKDYNVIKALVLKCFGGLDLGEILENIEGRYLLAFDGSRLVGMSGLMYNKQYGALEIDWSCVVPDMRRQGIMTNLISRLVGTTDESIYCSCWRLEDKEYPNMYNVLSRFGFKEVMKPRVTWDTRFNCGKGEYECPCVVGSARARGVCRCYEDLYVRL